MDRRVHVFAMDNFDWKKKAEGGSFHAITSIIIENPLMAINQPDHREADKLSIPVIRSQKTLSHVPHTRMPVCHISTKDRQKSRSLSNIEDLVSLATQSDNMVEGMLLVW